jgi:hypothetical protein
MLGALVGVVLGFFLKPLEERWLSAKLKIDFEKVPGNKDATDDRLYIRFRVSNKTERRIAKQCPAYVTELYKVSDGRVVDDNLLSDSFQLPWAGHDFEPRDVPAGIAQYVNLVQFSKHNPGWIILTTPGLYASLSHLMQYQGIYRFKVVVAGDGTKPATAEISVEYRNDWHNVLVYDS